MTRVHLVRILIATAVLLALGGFPIVALAQPAAPAPTSQDFRFVQALGSGGAAAIDAATAAGARAQSPQVRAYSQQVARDRTAMNAELAGIARQAGLQMPAGINPEHLRKRQQLDTSTAMSFDRVYLGGEVADHQETLQLLQAETIAGSNPALKSFASRMLPVVMQHSAQARALMTRASGGLPPGLATTSEDMRALGR